MTTVVQNYTNDQGDTYTRLIDETGRMTTWGPNGMLCREGCGEDAELAAGGRCRFCAGLEEPEEEDR